MARALVAQAVSGGAAHRRPRLLAPAALALAVLMLHLALLWPAAPRWLPPPARAAQVRMIEPPVDRSRAAVELPAVERAEPPPAEPLASPPRPPAGAKAMKRVAARRAPAASAPVMQPNPPVLAALPPPATLQFELRRGAQAGSAELNWQHDGARYAASLSARFDGGASWQWSSEGAFDAAGVAPERFVARGPRRGARAVNFQRDAALISYSGPTAMHPLRAGAQDRLSWMLQLAALAEAAPPAAGAELLMQVAGPGGDADVWRFEVLGPVQLQLGDAQVAALHLRREPRQRYDTRIEVWLDPAQHHLPVRALLSNLDDGREALEWLRRP